MPRVTAHCHKHPESFRPCPSLSAGTSVPQHSLTSLRSALFCSRRQPTWNSRSHVSQMMMVRSPNAPRRKSGSWHSTQPLPRPSVSCTTSGGLHTHRAGEAYGQHKHQSTNAHAGKLTAVLGQSTQHARMTRKRSRRPKKVGVAGSPSHALAAEKACWAYLATPGVAAAARQVWVCMFSTIAGTHPSHCSGWSSSS